jgi:hypothetical protein
MPMIMMSGLWNIAQENTRSIMEAGTPPE